MKCFKLLYFSLESSTRCAFIHYANASTHNKKTFRLIGCNEHFRHVQDLSYFLNSQEDLGYTYVIIDFISFCKDVDSIQKASESIRNTIIQFPEINFLFDQSGLKDDVSFLDFLFTTRSGHRILDDYHIFSIKNKEPFQAILNYRDNFFDCSNLRHEIKKYHYKRLNINKINFEDLQKSRHDNLAVSVEEESTQNRFNAYSLYSNGFRVIPINTSKELKHLNKHINNICKPDKSNELGKIIIIRDFDLQFSDISIDNKADCNEIDLIRDAKYIEKEEKEEEKEEKKEKEKEKEKGKEKGEWKVLSKEKENPYWSNLMDVTNKKEKKKEEKEEEKKGAIIFITKGPLNATIEYKENQYLLTQNKNKTLFIPGWLKPISGLYDTIQESKIIKKCYSKSIEYLTKPIDTSRKNHDHGVPLDVYDIVSSMIDRCWKYYGMQKYIRAAMISQEAMEILNGFHQALMIKAYHIHAISENAIAMRIIGGDEERLKNDTETRIERIKKDIYWILGGEMTLPCKNLKENKLDPKSKNILNQIFTDCKHFCREKEHFKSENAFISELAHINECSSMNMKTLVKPLINLVRKHLKIIWKHLVNFPFIWITFLFLLIAAVTCKLFIYIVLCLFLVLFILKPMNMIYGMIGTSGSFKIFFFNFIFVGICFTSIYYLGFFHNSGISYNSSHPHIYYGLCNDTNNFNQRTNNKYQPITFWDTMYNTMLTGIMQQPSGLFSIACECSHQDIPEKKMPQVSMYKCGTTIHRVSANDEIKIQKQYTNAFKWILLFQMLTSWLFLGVLISLIYNKFRHES